MTKLHWIELAFVLLPIIAWLIWRFAYDVYMTFWCVMFILVLAVLIVPLLIKGEPDQEAKWVDPVI